MQKKNCRMQRDRNVNDDLRVIRDAELQLHDAGRKPTKRLYMANEKKNSENRVTILSIFFFSPSLFSYTSALSPLPPFPSLSLTLSLSRVLLISDERLEDYLEQAIRRVEQGETRTLVTGSLGWAEGINEDGDARPGRRCLAMRRDAPRVPSRCANIHRLVEKESRESRDRVCAYIYIYIFRLDNCVSVRDKSFGQTRLICVQSKIDFADRRIGAWYIIIIPSIVYRNFYTCIRARTHAHTLSRYTSRYTSLIFTIEPIPLRSNLHSHWIVMQIARMQIATR